MNWPAFNHEAMATHFGIVIAGRPSEYARQAATAAFRELDRLEGELSRFIETSDIARANRLRRGDRIIIGEDALACLLIAADVSAATGRAFDPAYASRPGPEHEAAAALFALDPAGHALTALVDGLRLDLGAIGKGYALDRMAEILREWDVTAACLQSGGSTALALAPPPGETGWPVGLGGGVTHRVLSLTQRALAGSGLAVKGAHLADPRRGAGAPADRADRVWALAPDAATADALSTAFFVMSDAEVAAFCGENLDCTAVTTRGEGELVWHGPEA